MLTLTMIQTLDLFRGLNLGMGALTVDSRVRRSAGKDGMNHNLDFIGRVRN